MRSFHTQSPPPPKKKKKKEKRKKEKHTGGSGADAPLEESVSLNQNGLLVGLVARTCIKLLLTHNPMIDRILEWQ